MRRLRDLVEVVTAFLAAAVAGLSVMMPVDFARVSGTSALHQYLLVVNVPRADTAGAISAVVAVVLAVSLGDTRLTWIAAALTGVALLANAVLSRNLDTDLSLTTVNYIDSIFGGVLLGLIGAAVLRKRRTGTAFMLGAIASAVLGDLTELPSADSTSSGLGNDSPPLWSIVVVVVLIILSTCWHQRRRVELVPDRDAPFGSVVAAAIISGSTLLAAEWFAGHRVGTLPAIMAVAATVLITMMSAFILTGRDGSIVLIGVAYAAAASAIVAAPRPSWVLPILLVAVAAGLWAGDRWRSPLAAIGLVGALAFFAAVAPISDTGQLVPSIGAVALAAIAGYSYGATPPRLIQNRVVGIAVLFVPSVVLAIRGANDNLIGYSHLWYRSPATEHNPVAGWAALAIAGGCALGLLRLRAVRPATPPRPVNSLRAQRDSLVEDQ
ncbi:hypothetical protein OHB26_04320 [Nocardia sp. NBC_01503]|uniref:hypothetical protein n=1 Tax=Nocardia sp. NBC_01503 TaxID=2975997 RepID=UPI002E7B9466|nr:hypothetical protein [Nocardia sp. NBC_01503]WTL33475.1 hypothetical protein OHB26_04320 [Nocardia sp. NBC_01503]